jgi:glycosyltransferase involved in cell wall biosynthesis
VLSVGNDRAYKNMPALLEAMAQPALREANLVRNGPLTKAHREQIEALGLSGRVTPVQGLDDSLLACLYSASDALAQPSIAEGFGIPVIEAMACGLPVVTTDGGALQEVAGRAGIVVPLGPENFPARFAEALAGAIAQPRARAEAGLERAREFAPERVLPSLLAAYEAALARRFARK